MKLALAIVAAVSICAPEVAGGYFPKGSYDFLMVIGGMIEGDDKIDTVELVSLDPAGNPVPECLKNLSSLPYSAAGAAAGISADGSPLVCGGGGTSQLCYSYNPLENAWSLTGSMAVAKGNAAYGTSQVYGLTMVGGQSGDLVYDISESTLDGAGFTAHEPLPDESVSGCMAFLDEESFIYAGGVEDTSTYPATLNGTSVAYMSNLTSGSVVRLPDMPYATFGHGCGVVERGSSKEFVVVSGYEVLLEERQWVQIYSLEENAWRMGNDFLPMAYARSAPYSDSFVMVGGYNKGSYLDTVYYYEPETDSFTLLEGRLGSVKENVSPIMVKRAMFPECN